MGGGCVMLPALLHVDIHMWFVFYIFLFIFFYFVSFDIIKAAYQ